MLPPPNAPGGTPKTPVKGHQGHGPRKSVSEFQPYSDAQRGWVDKLTDAILGENEQSPNSRYALICSKCFSHNGLALKEELPDVRTSIFTLVASVFD
jgi:hypothetical protein